MSVSESGTPAGSHRVKTNCEVEATAAVIGGKWKPGILYHLIEGEKRFSELQRLIPDASDRMLTRSLRELEEDSLISRTVYAEVPARVEYALTDHGCKLIPVMEAMSAWGRAYGGFPD